MASKIAISDNGQQQTGAVIKVVEGLAKQLLLKATAKNKGD